MARASLRRQLFHQNLDRLLSDSALHPVQEENQNHEDKVAVSLDSQGEEDFNSTHLSECGGKSPIYKPRGDWRSSRKDTRNASVYDNMSPSYAEPWSPAIPIEETDQEPRQGKSLYTKKKKSMFKPLIFQYPDPNNNDINELPMSPISSSPMYSSTPQWPKAGFGSQTSASSGSQASRATPRWAQSGCKTCRKDDADVKALPMSPALFLTQPTSTPGTSQEEFNNPQCQTIREHSFAECNMCRICHDDGSKEKLVSPCHCAGTMGMLHMSCLERWLGSSNTTKCEICQFQFTVQKKRHPIKWYLQEPSLSEDRKAMVKDISLCICISLMVIIVSVLCLSFSGSLTGAGKHIGSIILILVASLVLVVYSGWLAVMSRRMLQRFRGWNKVHHQIQIQQSEEQDQNPKIKQRTSNRMFRRFPRIFSLKFKGKNENIQEGDLRSSTYISYSLESYKAAMFNPVTPTQPLLDPGHDITSLDVNSPSVMSLDDEDYYTTEESVSYYQPPEHGHTSVYYNETGKLLRETGV